MRVYIKQNNQLKSVRTFSKKDLAPKYDPVFGNNDWRTIKYAMQNQDMPATWLVGDTKEFVGKDGNTYHARLYDKQVGRYDYSDGSGRKTNGVIGFVELPNKRTNWNFSGGNVGGLANSLIRKNLNGLEGFQTGKNFMTDIIPDDLRPLLEEVNIVTATGGISYTGTSTSANKLFPPCYINVKTSTTPQYVAEGSLWDYYTTHTTDADRKKVLVTNLTSYEAYWLASPISVSTNSVNIVGKDGATSFASADGNQFVAPHWAW